jgi:hypothetical protein
VINVTQVLHHMLFFADPFNPDMSVLPELLWLNATFFMDQTLGEHAHSDQSGLLGGGASSSLGISLIN